MDSEKPSQFDNLPVEGWFWELVRRDARFRKRFAQMEEAVQAHAASRLTDDDYGRALKNYLAHLRRYGIETFSLPGPEDRKNLAGPRLLPYPSPARKRAAPRSAEARRAVYGLRARPEADPAQNRQAGKGLRPRPHQETPRKIRPSRKEINSPKKTACLHGKPICTLSPKPNNDREHGAGTKDAAVTESGRRTGGKGQRAAARNSMAHQG